MDCETDDFYRIIVGNIPLIDLRAPVEFEAGAFPTAVNLPIMDDHQRHLVGLRYKEKGQSSAVELGHQLVSGDLKKSHVTTWLDFIASHPETVLYCFRGGKRSQFTQKWLEEQSGRTIPRLAGGYKALRRYLLEQFESPQLGRKPVLLGGRTGAGKTVLLRQFDNFIDLEALANHRGSSFGRFLTPQPSLVDFENRLAWELVQHKHCGDGWILLEDEGRHVGRCYIPNNLAEHFSRGSLILLETPLEQRIDNIWKEYVIRDQLDYSALHGLEHGIDLWFQAMNSNLERIRKRLGGERLKRVESLLASAHACQQQSSDLQEHRKWIEVLICEYYDPMYDFQLKKRSRDVIFRGGEEEVMQFLLTMK